MNVRMERELESKLGIPGTLCETAAAVIVPSRVMTARP